MWIPAARHLNVEAVLVFTEPGLPHMVNVCWLLTAQWHPGPLSSSHTPWGTYRVIVSLH